MTARPDGTRHHTELINGTLVPGPPQRSGHSRVVTALTSTLMNQAPMSMEIERDMTLRLDARNHLVPDLLATPLPYDANRTWYAPADVRLVVEVVSPDSARRDRTVKPRAYAEAGIPHYWRVEDEEGAPSSTSTNSTLPRAPMPGSPSHGAPSASRARSRSRSTWRH